MGGFSPLQWGSDPTQPQPAPDPTQQAPPVTSSTLGSFPSGAAPATFTGGAPPAGTADLENQIGPAQQTLLITIVAGVFRVLLSGGHPVPAVPLPPPPPMTEAVSYWLLLKVFASGCTALTGVEAVSNGVKAFREPTGWGSPECSDALSEGSGD
jgi:hypothetical protein